MKVYIYLFFCIFFLLTFFGCDDGNNNEVLSVFDIKPDIKEEVVFQEGTIQKPTFRIPSIIISNKKTILLACENRQSWEDRGEIDIVIARKRIGEIEWEKQVLFEMNDGKGRTMNPIFLVDRESGRIYIFASHFKDNTKYGYDHETSEFDLVYRYSDDDGLTWSEEISLKKYWDTTKYTGISSSASNGIITTNGVFLIPMIVIKNNKFYSCLLIKEIGKEWRFSSYTHNEWDNECTVYIDEQNRIILDCRTLESIRNKYVYDIKKDEFIQIESDIIDSYVSIKAEITRCEWKGHIFYLMSYPDTRTGTRENLSLYGSIDGIHWKIVCCLQKGYNGLAYSNIAWYEDKVLVTYEIENSKSKNSIKVIDISNIMDDTIDLLFNNHVIQKNN